MKVIATAPGFYGSYRNTDDKFDVAEGEKASWFVPVEPPKAARGGKKVDPTDAEDLTKGAGNE